MYEFTQPENQTMVWLPTNEDTKTITYDIRTLISNNDIHPIAWSVSKVEDTLPIGITKVTLAQTLFDPVRDNKELMIADYYTTNIGMEPHDLPKPIYNADHSKIAFRGTQQVLKVNGSFKTFVPKFYDKNNNELTTIHPVWDIIYPDDDDKDKFKVVYDGNNLKIKCLNYFDLIGKVVRIQLNDENGTMPSSIDLEVVSL